MSRFDGKVVVVTGGSSGIGAATAARFAAEGANVMIGDIQEPQHAPSKSHFMKTDVTSKDEVDALVEATVAQWGRLDTMVANAGIGSFGPTEDLDPAIWEKTFAVNSTGVFLACRAAIPHLKEAKGSIVNTASISGIAGDFYMAAYNASKGAVVNLTRSLAIELGQYGVRVNSVCPGLVDTPLAGSAIADPEDRAHWSGLIPMGRPAVAEDIAGAIAFLASDDAGYITGTNLAVDGGLTAHTGQPDFMKRAQLRQTRA